MQKTLLLGFSVADTAHGSALDAQNIFCDSFYDPDSVLV